HSGEFSACGILAVAVVTATRRSTPEPEHGIWGCFRSVQSVALLLVALVGALDLLLRVDAAGPGGALHALARLQVLVDLEEVLDLQPVEQPGGALHALARLLVLVDLEEVLDLQPVELGQV